jgi:hypothetical protein
MLWSFVRFRTSRTKENAVTVVQLTREQEAIARAAMASGRYGGPEAVVDAALKLFNQREEQRAAFV